jgi:hypothetical protein
MVTASAAIMVSLLTSCARASAGLLIGLREEKQSAGVLLGGFDECHKLDCSACVAHQLSGERSVDGSGPQLVATGVKRFGCSPAMESSRHRAFDPSTGVRQPGNDCSSAVQRCLSADKPVRGMNRASPGWGNGDSLGSMQVPASCRQSYRRSTALCDQQRRCRSTSSR